MKTVLICSGIALLIGVGLGYKLGRGKTPPVESYRPETIQKDGSRIVERRPTNDLPKPPHIVPSGYKVERIIKTTIQPTTLDPINVDLSLVRGSDGTRVILSTDKGTVLNAVDIPRLGREAPRPRNAIGMTYRLNSQTAALTYDRDAGPFRFGAELARKIHFTGAKEYDLGLRVAIVF